MNANCVWLGNSALHSKADPAAGGFSTLDGERYALIGNVDSLAPFLMSVVTASDMWIFVGSNGPFTAGRVDPDHALFPYQTVDKLLRSPDVSGALTTFLVRRNGRLQLWQPWHDSGGVYRILRNLYKHIHGGNVIFEEVNTDLELTFRWSLSAGDPYGLVRECALENTGAQTAEVRYLDGWRRLLPPGVTVETFSRYSYLAEGYMRHDRVPGLPMGVFTLNAGITDTSHPCEMLRATAAWSLGHGNPTVLLCDRQVEAFRCGETVYAEDEVRGESGSFLIADSVTLAPSSVHRWVSVADTQLDHAALARLQRELEAPETLADAVRTGVAANREGLRRLIAGADGLQHTAGESATVHHFANALYNAMRGGTFEDSYRFPRRDLADYLSSRNSRLAQRHAKWLSALPDILTLDELRTAAAVVGDPQLIRLAGEYLPLVFSRRHGDPSRPWNNFAIHVSGANGDPVYGYEGNWRDIFQNWESLALSFPEALDAMIAVFLNASTADGYNPYRITREGIDWEVHNPADPWSNTGYWGDHQIVYLLRLLESSERFHPGRIAAGLRDSIYSYAHVPYEIARFDAILADPRHTITFNHPLHERLVARAGEIGADGKLVTDGHGEVLLVPLAEKLLVPLLTKLSNLVPGGGIWLNTQRPEWNDANNALAGWGLSVVTVHYIRRYLAFLDGVLASAVDAPIDLSTPVAVLLERITRVLESLKLPADDLERFQALAELGRAGEAYRTELYRDGLRGSTTVTVSSLRELIAAAMPVVESTICSNRRNDGLYHSYNVLHIVGGGRAEVRHLFTMLEGQVAALSSGLLSPREVVKILSSLRASSLYDPERKSYTLYPDRTVTPFLRRNVIPAGAAETVPVLVEFVAAGEESVIVADDCGQWHFQADIRNAADLVERMDALAACEAWAFAVERDRQVILDLWECVFRHSEFTGRSGTFFAFEGLGSVYWHMVAKLLVAVQECRQRAVEDGAEPDVLDALAEAGEGIRDGLGYRKTAAEYGAFPTDPYSHTPLHRGAQQPGMTGQVKEEIITRLAELGVEVQGGCLRFAPEALNPSEFTLEAASFSYINVRGENHVLQMPAGSLAFTICQTPVCYQISSATGIEIRRADGTIVGISDMSLSPADSASIFQRRGEIVSVTAKIAAK